MQLHRMNTYFSITPTKWLGNSPTNPLRPGPSSLRGLYRQLFELDGEAFVTLIKTVSKTSSKDLQQPAQRLLATAEAKQRIIQHLPVGGKRI